MYFFTDLCPVLFHAFSSNFTFHLIFIRLSKWRFSTRPGSASDRMR
ncbi:hypothetical protein BN1182_AZ_01450 [Pantoea ananatis]|nr:hypothetical protein BN1182_AZ_01450 [Pantoea ananatis]